MVVAVSSIALPADTGQRGTEPCTGLSIASVEVCPRRFLTSATTSPRLYVVQGRHRERRPFRPADGRDHRSDSGNRWPTDDLQTTRSTGCSSTRIGERRDPAGLLVSAQARLGETRQSVVDELDG